MKILMISQYYPPENTYLVPSLAHSLADQGHDVRVLTGYPNYPSGRVFDGYKQRWRGYEQDGLVRVCRVPLFADHSQRPIRRILNYLSFGLSTASARRFAVGADVIYVYATQLTAALGPWLWRRIGGAPYVLHVQDLWPDSIVGSSLVAPGRGARLVASILTPWIASVYRRAETIVGIAPTMVETLVSRGVPEEKVRLVFNWADEASFPDDRVTPDAGAQGKTRVLYAGNVGDMQDLETAVEAAHRAAGAGLQLTIIGDGVALPRIRALAERLEGSNIEFRPPVPSYEVRDAYQGADFALVSLKDLPAFRGTIPSKLQAALSYGVPVISTVQGDVRHLVEDLELGFTADAEDTSSLEVAFRDAAGLEGEERQLMSARASAVYRERFSREGACAALGELLADAVQGARIDHERRDLGDADHFVR